MVMTAHGKKPKVEATSVASPRSRKSGEREQQEFTRQVELVVKNLEKVLGKGIQLEVEPKIPIKINKKKLN